MIRVVVTGVGGRMGRSVVRCVSEADDMRLVGATEREGSAFLGQDAGMVAGITSLSVTVVNDLDTVLENGADVVIDFSSPEASMNHARICAERGVALVVGTTGLEAKAHQAMADAARKIPLLVAPNTSAGVNMMFKLVTEAARALGNGCDIEIMEMHHRHKKDAPSGTALRLGEMIAKTLNRDPRADLRLTRSGAIGERGPREIGIQAIRGGDVVGDHTVFFIGDGERLEITHRSTSRDQLTIGALRAARFLVGKPKGIYDMFDVLGLK